MSPVAEQLDRQLKSLPAELASSVERVVWDVLKVAAARTSSAAHDGDVLAHRRHLAECVELASGMDWSSLERPEQGVDEVRSEG